MSQVLEFLIPENTAAFIIVNLILILFVIWLVGLFILTRRLSYAKNQLLKLEDIDSLVKARDSYFLSSQGGEKKNELQLFDGFIKKKFNKPVPSIVTHVKSIFLAGLKEGRLEVSELNRLTLQEIFRWHYAIRACLATFIVMGLLGTLFGLADSLANLSPVMQSKLSTSSNAGTNEAIIAGLTKLLLALKSAFAPSIWGVALTILGIAVHSGYIRFFAIPVQQTLERLTLTVWIPKLFPTRSQAEIERLEKSAELMQQNVESVKQVSEFAKNITDETGQLHDNLNQAIALTGSYDTAVKQVNQAAEILKIFSEKFTTDVSVLSSFQNEIKSLYQQMLEGTEKFRQVYGESLDKQNTSIEGILSGLKSYEEAYIKERGSIDSKLKTLIDETTEATTSVNTKNRIFIEELRQQLVNELNRLNEALEVGLTDLRDKFGDIRKPFDETAKTIEGTFQNFDKDLREIFGKEIIKQFNTQNEQNKKVLDEIINWNTKMGGLFLQLSKNSEEQNEQLKNLNKTILNFGDISKSLQSTFTFISIDLKDFTKKFDMIVKKVYPILKVLPSITEKQRRRDHPPKTTGRKSQKKKIEENGIEEEYNDVEEYYSKPNFISRVRNRISSILRLR